MNNVNNFPIQYYSRSLIYTYHIELSIGRSSIGQKIFIRHFAKAIECDYLLFICLLCVCRQGVMFLLVFLCSLLFFPLLLLLFRLFLKTFYVSRSVLLCSVQCMGLVNFCWYVFLIQLPPRANSTGISDATASNDSHSYSIHQ